MVLCAAINCSNRSVRNADVSYFCFPRIIENKGTKIKETSERRMNEWLSRINRADLSEKNLKYKKVCSEHFIHGKPSSLLDETNPDWAPSVKLGHTKYKFDSLEANDRYERAYNRKQMKTMQIEISNQAIEDLTSASNERSSSVDEHLIFHDRNNINDEPVASISVECSSELLINNSQSICVQTDCSISYINQLETEIDNLKKENKIMQEKLQRLYISEENIDDQKVQFYTGLPSLQMLHVVFNYISPKMQYKPVSLTFFQSFLIFMMRLRLNLLMQDLAFRFAVSQSTVVRVFDAWLEAAFISMSPTVFWPERSALRLTMPTDFKLLFGSSVAVILDCFEIKIDRPTSITARAATWSNYKHHNTIKILIGISPQGVITFVSEAWGGRVSDKYITENCGILEKLLPGDFVMADRGFSIGDAVGFYCAQLIKPASARGKKQLSPKEIQETRKVASLRINVERVIGNLRQKYSILKGQLPIESLTIKEGEKYSPVDKIVKVCSAFTNLSKSIVSLT